MVERISFTDEKITFAGLGPGETTVSKPEVMGKRLWEKLFERDPKFGGVTCSFYGVPGSGKTSLMLQVCRRISKEYPQETIFWREPDGVPIQVLNLGLPVHFFCDDKIKLRIKELTEDGPVPTDDHKILRFQNPAKLLQMIQPGINCVYFNDRKGWLRLIRRMKGNLSWQSFFIDECEDIFSSRSSGRDWYLTEDFVSHIKELRKSRVSMYINSQTDWDIDPRIKSKLMLEVFLYGSKKNEHSPLYRSVLQGMEIGEGWVSYAHSQFGKIRFGPIEPLDKQYIAVTSTNRGKL